MDLKERIKESKTANFLNRASDEILKELESLTSFLPSDYETAIRYWYVKNEKIEIQTCKCCKIEPKFHGISKGYSLYCSVECRRFDTDQRHKINREIKSELDEIRLKEDPDNFIKCEICGSAIKLLKNHLLNSHKEWTLENYNREFPNAKTIAKSTSEKNSENNKGDKNIFSKSRSTEDQRKSRSIFSLEWWRKRHPEKSEEELFEIRNLHLKNKLKGRFIPSQKEYWMAKGFSEEDSLEKIRERQKTFSLERCIEKFGEEEGRKRFEIRQRKWSESLFRNFEKNGDGRSLQSKWASEIIDRLCKELKIEKPKKEKWISSKNRDLRCSYDFTSENKIIEFHGDMWHANPLIYDQEFEIPKCKIKASDKWKIDEEKIKLAESHGYEVLVVWESEFKSNPEKIINKCLRFLSL